MLAEAVGADVITTVTFPHPATRGRGILNHMPIISIRLIPRHAGWDGRWRLMWRPRRRSWW